jgi:hypothetical protein
MSAGRGQQVAALRANQARREPGLQQHQHPMAGHIDPADDLVEPEARRGRRNASRIPRSRSTSPPGRSGVRKRVFWASNRASISDIGQQFDFHGGIVAPPPSALALAYGALSPPRARSANG